MLLPIINIVTLSQIVLFVIFLSIKRNLCISNRLLIGFLIAQGFVYINNLGFFYYEYVYKNLPHLIFIGQAFMFLWAPLLYLYICSITTANFTIKRNHLIHFVPFTAAFIFMLFAFYLHDAETKQYIMDTRDIGFYFQIGVAIVHVQILAYMIFALVRLHWFAIQLKDNYANLDKINLNWLRLLLYSYLVSWLITLSVYIMQWFMVNPPEILQLIVFLFFFVFFNIIVFKALSTPEIFYVPVTPVKERRKSLSESKRKEYMEKLEKYVQEKKPYLSSTICLNDLAYMVEIPPRSLSEVLNESLNQSFFDYINAYRIDEAEQLLYNTEEPSITVSEVVYDVGFNSKSSFYSAFKKHKGYSPSRLKQLRSASPSNKSL